MFQGVKYTDLSPDKQKEKVCPVCQTPFIAKSGSHKFCKEECKGKWKYLSKKVTSTTQYKNISGNWEKYFARLITFHNRKQDGLTAKDLISILHKQDFKCALSGVTLTCLLDVGTVFKTNASIDRISAGGPYIKENVQLVCSALNKFRVDTSVEEFIWWCQQVAKYQEI